MSDPQRPHAEGQEVRPPTKHVALRLDQATLARVDALIAPLSTPWYTAKRSDVLRALVIEALPVLEQRYTKGATGAPSSRKKRGAR